MSKSSGFLPNIIDLNMPREVHFSMLRQAMQPNAVVVELVDTLA